jgi:hypothetical protein
LQVAQRRRLRADGVGHLQWHVAESVERTLGRKEFERLALRHRAIDQLHHAAVRDLSLALQQRGCAAGFGPTLAAVLARGGRRRRPVDGVVPCHAARPALRASSAVARRAAARPRAWADARAAR